MLYSQQRLSDKSLTHARTYAPQRGDGCHAVENQQNNCTVCSWSSLLVPVSSRSLRRLWRFTKLSLRDTLLVHHCRMASNTTMQRSLESMVVLARAHERNKKRTWFGARSQRRLLHCRSGTSSEKTVTAAPTDKLSSVRARSLTASSARSRTTLHSIAIVAQGVCTAGSWLIISH